MKHSSLGLGDFVEVDVLGIGFGPSNLALAVAAESIYTKFGSKLSLKFVEKKPSFSWHSSMLIDNSKMQVSFLKDLVTQADPTSPYSFINFLFVQKRLNDFINLRTFFPLRHEYQEYLLWVAKHVSDYTAYGQEVRGISPILENDTVTGLAIECFDSESQKTVAYRSRGAVISMGAQPYYPPSVDKNSIGHSIFHSSEFLQKIKPYEVAGLGAKLRFLVVGAGQSGAEIFNYLGNKFPQSTVKLLTRRFSLMPSNSSPLCNEIFNPEMVDWFHDAPSDNKKEILNSLNNTNYAVVDDELIRQIYGDIYTQKILGIQRLEIIRMSDLISCKSKGTKVEVVINDTHKATVVGDEYDAVILATGYNYNNVESLISELTPYIHKENDQIKISKDYVVSTKSNFLPKLYVQGHTMQSHGLSSSLLSVLAVRGRDIANSLHQAFERPHSHE